MPRKRKPKVKVEDLVGFRYFKQLTRTFDRLEETRQDCRRRVHYRDYVLALLFYFFNPLLTSLRALQQATEFKKVRKVLGIKRMSLGALSEAVDVFEPRLLEGVVRELAEHAPARKLDPRLKELKQIVTAVDGSILPALPRMVWAFWLGERGKGVRLHVQLEVAKNTPVGTEVTTGVGSEVAVLREKLEPGRLYVMDRGYMAYGLLEEILQAGSSFVVRARENVAYEVLEERAVTPEAQKEGVVSDKVVDVGAGANRGTVSRPLRLIEIFVPESKPRGLGYQGKRVSSKKSVREERGKPYTLYLLTDRQDLPPDVVGLTYRHRWKVELFFRTLKSLLGCRHLVSESPDGVTIQVYCALIAALLLAKVTGVRPSKRTYELLGLMLSGWVTEEEFLEHLAKLKNG